MFSCHLVAAGRICAVSHTMVVVSRHSPHARLCVCVCLCVSVPAFVACFDLRHSRSDFRAPRLCPSSSTSPGVRGHVWARRLLCCPSGRQFGRQLLRCGCDRVDCGDTTDVALLRCRAWQLVWVRAIEPNRQPPRHIVAACTMRVELIVHFKPCMTDIYLHI